MTELRQQPRRSVAEVMTSPPIMIQADASVTDAAEILWSEGIGAVLVGGPDDVLGVLSERDVVALLAHGGNPDLTLVREAMTSPVIQLDVTDTVLDAAIQAVDIGVRHLPVMDGGVVGGVVSIRDLVLPASGSSAGRAVR